MGRLSDRGLQPERTALAWNRTGLAVLVNAVLVLRSGTQLGSRPITAMGIALLVAAAIVTVYAAHRKRQLASHAVSAPPAAALMAMSATAMFACLAALALIWQFGNGS